MSTATMERSLLDTPVNEIDFANIDPIEELRKIQPRFMERYDRLNGVDKVTFLRSYEVQAPQEEALLQFAIDAIAPAKLGQTAESLVRQAMAEEAAKGIEIDSPEKEAEWEAKLQAARLQDKEKAAQLKNDRAAQFGPGASKMTLEDDGKSEGEGLIGVKGLGAKSVEKLHEAGITTVADFKTLNYEKLEAICGRIVAVSFFPAKTS